MEWKSENRIIKRGFAAAIFALLSICVFSHFFFLRNMEQSKLVQHSYQVLEKSKALLSNINEAETGFRGFIITGNENFLQPYYISIDRNDNLFADLKQLLSDNPIQQKRCNQVSDLINKKYAFSKKVLELRRKGGMDSTLPLINGGEGKRLMDSIRNKILLIESKEKELLKQREIAAESSESIAKILIPVGMFINAAILILLYYVLRKQLKRRKVIEETLEETNEWFSKTLFSIGDAVITTDRDFNITYVNPVAEELTGWKEKEVKGEPVDNIFNTIHEVTRQKVENPIVKAIAEKRIILLPENTILIRKDKTEIFIDDSGSPIINSNGEVIGAVLIFRDITEQKKTQAKLADLTKNLEQKVIEKTNELQKNEAQFEKTLDSILEGIEIISFEWRYLYVNDTAVLQNRFSREELIGFTVFEKFPNIENTELFRVLKRCMHERIPAKFESEFTFPDNTTRWYKFSVEPIPDGIFLLSIDITDRKNAEKQNQEYVYGLEEMIFMTSHKVRPPITQIMGIYNMLEDDTINSQDELRRITRYLKESVSSLDKITKELSTFIHNLRLKSENNGEPKNRVN